jgi:hypothetical protein
LPLRLLLRKVNAIIAKYFNPLTIFGSIADKMAKTMKEDFLQAKHTPLKRKIRH